MEENCQPCKTLRFQYTTAETYCQDCDELLCMECTKRHAVLMNNHRPISIKDESNETVHMNCNLCKRNGKSSPAVTFCEVCDTTLCKQCFRLHIVEEATKNHRLIAVEDYLSGKQKLCKVCHGTPVTNICRQCSELLCWNCSILHKQQETTQNHTVVPAYEKVMPEIHNCNPCLQRGQNAPYEQYCPECEEFLCKACIPIHKTRKATSHHTLINKDDHLSDDKTDLCKVCHLEVTNQEATCVTCNEHLRNFIREKTSKATRIPDIVQVSRINQPSTNTSNTKGKLDGNKIIVKEICDVCRHDGETNEAIFACVECNEMICNNCKDLHNKTKATRNHDLVDVDSLIQTRTSKSDTKVTTKVIKNTVKEACDVCRHDGKLKEATFACVDCNENICNDCKDLHKKTKVTRSHAIIDINNRSQYRKQTSDVTGLDNENLTAVKEACDVCRYDGKLTEAHFGCIECNEKICNDCKILHNKTKSTRNHDIVDVIILIQTSKHTSETTGENDGNTSTVKEACDVCQYDGKLKDASFGCVECEEKLCNDCRDLHKKTKATRNHNIVDVRSFNKNSRTKRDKESTQDDQQNIVTDICDVCQYSGKRKEAIFACVACNEMLCIDCKNAHRQSKTTKSHGIGDVNSLNQAGTRLSETQSGNDGPGDTVKDVCDVCQYSGKTTEAIFACVACNEKLCIDCKNVHRQSKATKSHNIGDVSSLKQVGTHLSENQGGNDGQADIVIDVCDVCQYRGKTKEALYACVSCNEKLCIDCKNVHRQSKATKSHNIGDVSSLNQVGTHLRENQGGNDGQADIQKDVCDVCQNNGKNKEAIFACVSCNEKLCIDCKNVHRQSKATKSHNIGDVSSLNQVGTHLRENQKGNDGHGIIVKDVCDVCQYSGKTKEAIFACAQCEEKLCDECKILHQQTKASRNHNIVDVSSLSHSDMYTCDICVANGKSTNAVRYCEECKEYLCQNCTDNHKRRRATATHSLKAPEDFTADWLCKHCLRRNKKNKAKMYCPECDENLCASCTEAHRNHRATERHKLNDVRNPRSRRPAILCDLCLIDNKEINALKYCNNCRDNLCGDCLKYHVRSRSTKVHDLSDRPRMPSPPKDVPKSSPPTDKPNNPPTEKPPVENAEHANDRTLQHDRKKPGKPVASKVKTDSLELTWTKPGAFTTLDSFQVRCKDLDHNGKWKFLPEEYTESSILLTDLKGHTKFIFQVRMIHEEEEGPYSEPSDVVTTLQSPGGELQGFSKLVERGDPSKYAPPMTEIKSARNVTAKSRRLELGAPPQAACKEKTIMLVGATGTGKSTLVDGLVNYILGVNWNDPYRYTIIDLESEEKQRLSNQALSQTEWITCYDINPKPGSRLDYRLTIIDTPGFGDTRGLQRDGEIVDQIRELFSATNEKGVAMIDAVCFLIKAPDARLNTTQKYIFHAIMSLFGQDIEHNICSMITFADGQDPPVIASLKESALPFGKYFTFNNSGLFSANMNLNSTSLSPMFWEMGIKSYRAFFGHLSKLETKSLFLTQQVLDERHKLENTISSLQPQVDAGLSKLDELKKELRVMDQHKADIKDNVDFKYDCEETKQIQKDLPIGHHVTNCLNCNITCHEDCKIPDDDNKAKCVAMDIAGNCTICQTACHWTLHKNARYIIAYVTETVTKTYDEKKKKYEELSGQVLSSEQILDKMYEEIEDQEEEILSLMDKVNQSNNRLKQIALRDNPLSLVEYIDLMIESEKSEKKDGFQGRITSLLQYKQKADIGKGVERFTQEAAGTFGPNRKKKTQPKPQPKKGKTFSFSKVFKF